MNALIAAWTATLFAGAPDTSWPQFRGPRGDGILTSLNHPLEWSGETNVAWKTPLPGAGWSSPVCVGDLVFITTAVGEGYAKPKNMRTGAVDPSSMPFFGGGKPPEKPLTFELHCVDRQTGSPKWNLIGVETAPKIPVHPSNTFATESPAADHEGVYAFFGAAGVLVCADHQGNKLWEKSFEVFPITNGFGTGSSLLLADGRLFLQRDNEKQSSLTALDGKTGNVLWQSDRASKSSWSTPYLWRHRQGTDLVACGSGSVIAHDPATGEEKWRMTNISSSFSASPTSNEELLFFGSSGPFSSSPLYAIRSGAKGDITLAKGSKSNDFVAWSRTGSGPGMASPVVIGDLIYVPGDGILKVFESLTGKEVYKQRVPGARIFVASPWSADGKLFLMDEDGTTFVMKTGPKFELLGTNKIEGTFWASPAIAGDSLLLRGIDALYCIRESP